MWEDSNRVNPSLKMTHKHTWEKGVFEVISVSLIQKN